MVSSQIRAEARNNLAGKWGKAALLTLVYMVITYIISWVLSFIPVIGPLVSTVISPVLGFGYLIGFIKLKRGEEVGYVDFFKNGFSQFGKVWAVIGQTILKIILPIIALIISLVLLMAGGIGSISSDGLGALAVIGFIAFIASLIWFIVKYYSYVLSQYILYDNPDMDSKAIVEKSAELMNGHKWAYFWLPITFIGWIILGTITFGIGLLWVIPYMQVALVIFYENLAGKLETTPVNEKPEETSKPEEDEGPISE